MNWKKRMNYAEYNILQPWYAIANSWHDTSELGRILNIQDVLKDWDQFMDDQKEDREAIADLTQFTTLNENEPFFDIPPPGSSTSLASNRPRAYFSGNSGVLPESMSIAM